MAKRDFIYDTKAGRLSLGVVAVFLIILGLVLLVLSILLGRGQHDGFWQTLVLALSSVVVGVCNLVVLKKRKPQVLPESDTDQEPDPERQPAPIPGEPDDQIVVNPTRANEPDGSILLYRKEGVLAYKDKRIPIDWIVDAFVINNNSNPYLPPEYYLRLNLEDGSFERIPAGLDAEWAQEALKHLQEAVLSGK